MTSFKEPNFSYTEATLRCEVHTDNSHWELMYKAMLAQLMTYVDAAVARALAERGIDERFTASARAARLHGAHRTAAAGALRHACWSARERAPARATAARRHTAGTLAVAYRALKYEPLRPSSVTAATGAAVHARSISTTWCWRRRATASR
jgi:hypothetical protein